MMKVGGQERKKERKKLTPDTPLIYLYRNADSSSLGRWVRSQTNLVKEEQTKAPKGTEGRSLREAFG
jgi:hypothetical protein